MRFVEGRVHPVSNGMWKFNRPCLCRGWRAGAVTAAGRIHLKKELQFRLYIPGIFSCKKEVTGILELDPLCGN